MARACGCERAGEFSPLCRGRRSETGAKLLAARVGPELPSRLGIDEPQNARIRQLLLARVPDLDRDHIVPAGELEQRATPVERTTKVAHDDHRRPLPGKRRGPVERLAE